MTVIWFICWLIFPSFLVIFSFFFGGGGWFELKGVEMGDMEADLK